MRILSFIIFWLYDWKNNADPTHAEMYVELIFHEAVNEVLGN